MLTNFVEIVFPFRLQCSDFAAAAPRDYMCIACSLLGWRVAGARAARGRVPSNEIDRTDIHRKELKQKINL